MPCVFGCLRGVRTDRPLRIREEKSASVSPGSSMRSRLFRPEEVEMVLVLLTLDAARGELEASVANAL